MHFPRNCLHLDHKLGSLWFVVYICVLIKARLIPTFHLKPQREYPSSAFLIHTTFQPPSSPRGLFLPSPLPALNTFHWSPIRVCIIWHLITLELGLFFNPFTWYPRPLGFKSHVWTFCTLKQSQGVLNGEIFKGDIQKEIFLTKRLERFRAKALKGRPGLKSVSIGLYPRTWSSFFLSALWPI